jgi:hypothetical protein
VLSALAREKVEIFAFNVYKGAQRIPHTSENYGLALGGLLTMCLSQDEAAELVIDMPFSNAEDRAALTSFIQDQLGLAVTPQYVDSQVNPYVQLADFVAGAMRTYHTGRSRVFQQFVHDRIVGDQMILWRDLKREWHQRTRE